MNIFTSSNFTITIIFYIFFYIKKKKKKNYFLSEIKPKDTSRYRGLQAGKKNERTGIKADIAEYIFL